ncbi:MAG: Maf family nucleotide pyrophosphatase [Candidatus Cryptobacteroides sp.]
MIQNKKIILGSGSPRRKEILSMLDIEFEIDTRSTFQESYTAETPNELVPKLMSEGKSKGFHRILNDNELLITADTMVICNEKIFGKPKDNMEAYSMLKCLSGKKHKVVTSVTFRTIDNTETFVDCSTVTFKDLKDEEINYYIDNFKPYDKAGSYGIQEWIGAIGITSIEGSFYNIMGLPVHLVYFFLKKFSVI